MVSKYVQGTTGAVTPNYDFAEAIRQLLLDVGWTLFDTVSNTPGSSNRVFKTPASAARQFYLQVLETSTSNLSLRCFGHYDAATNTGKFATFALGGAQGGVPTATTLFNYYAIANEWGIVIESMVGVSNYLSFAGCLDNHSVYPPHMRGVAVASGAVAAGATFFPTTEDMTSSLVPNMTVLLLNLEGDTIEQRVIQSVSAEGITFGTALTNSYVVGSLVGIDPLPICVSDGDQAGVDGGDGAANSFVYFAYEPNAAKQVQRSYRVWSIFFDAFSRNRSGYATVQRSSSVPLLPIARPVVQAADEPLGPRGLLPDIIAHCYHGSVTTVPIVGDRIRVDVDSYYKVVRINQVALLFGPRPSSEIA